jgi:uncharacterized membrane protein YqhA
MRKLFELSKYLTLIPSLALVVGAVAMMGYGVYGTGRAIIEMLQGSLASPTVRFIELIDTFLVAVSLYVFAVGIYELFIGDLDVPDWLVIKHLHDLKQILGSLVILIMAIKFLTKLVEAKDTQALLFTGIAVAVVSAALIAFTRFDVLNSQSHQEPH